MVMASDAERPEFVVETDTEREFSPVEKVHDDGPASRMPTTSPWPDRALWEPWWRVVKAKIVWENLATTRLYVETMRMMPHLSQAERRLLDSILEKCESSAHADAP